MGNPGPGRGKSGPDTYNPGPDTGNFRPWVVLVPARVQRDVNAIVLPTKLKLICTLRPITYIHSYSLSFLSSFLFLRSTMWAQYRQVAVYVSICFKLCFVNVAFGFLHLCFSSPTDSHCYVFLIQLGI